MKSTGMLHVVLLMIPGLLFYEAAWGQQVRYNYPGQEFSFMATPNWDEEYGDYNGKEFKVIHPNHGMRISISFVPGCHHPGRYMRKASGLRGLVCPGGNYDTLLHGYHALIMRGHCQQGKRPFTRMMVGFPVEEGLYVMEFCCPDECYAGHRDLVMEILDSVRIGV